MNLNFLRGNINRRFPPSERSIPIRRRSWTVQALTIMVIGVLLLGPAACGSATSSTTTTTVAPGPVVRPPAVPLQGCSYVLNGVVPAGEPMGIKPDFPAFTPDQAAQSAVSHIAAHGGTGLVYGFTLPPDVKLFSGPDASRSPVATIPLNHSILAADPVLWTTRSGAHWLAFFIACGGEHLYWVSVDQIGKADAGAGAEAVRAITALESAAPYTLTGRASILPLKIMDGQLTWNAPTGTHALVVPARGQLLGF